MGRTQEEEDRLQEEIRKHAPDGWITCDSAMALSQHLNIEFNEFRDLLDKLDIKLTKCQFGCF